MKQLTILLLGILLFASCKSTRVTIPDNEKYVAVQITAEQADEYERAYQGDPKFKANFRNGMYLPVDVIDQLRKTEGIKGFSIYYGKHPDYASPVFILYPTDISAENQQQKSAKSGVDPIYLVYYPCPTMCGK